MTSNTNQPSPGSVEEMRAALAEIHAAMLVYQRDADTEQTPAHREMMSRVSAALANHDTSTPRSPAARQCVAVAYGELTDEEMKEVLVPAILTQEGLTNMLRYGREIEFTFDELAQVGNAAIRASATKLANTALTDTTLAVLPHGWELVRGGDDIQLIRADGKWCGYSPEVDSPAHRMTHQFLKALLTTRDPAATPVDQ